MYAGWIPETLVSARADTGFGRRCGPDEKPTRRTSSFISELQMQKPYTWYPPSPTPATSASYAASITQGRRGEVRRVGGMNRHRAFSTPAHEPDATRVPCAATPCVARAPVTALECSASKPPCAPHVPSLASEDDRRDEDRQCAPYTVVFPVRKTRAVNAPECCKMAGIVGMELPCPCRSAYPDFLENAVEAKFR